MGGCFEPGVVVVPAGARLVADQAYPASRAARVVGAAARRARRRASGTLTLTMPGSAGGRSPGLAGSLLVSRQAAGWAGLPAGHPGLAGRQGRGVPGGGDGQQ